MTFPELVLFLAPTRQATEQPVVNLYTRRMCSALRQSKRSDYAYGGFHRCVCGARSSDIEYFLPTGEKTNSLCVHYLAHHRDEVPADELKFVGRLDLGEAEPTEPELQGPIFVLDDSRRMLAKYLGPERLRIWIEWGLDFDGFARALATDAIRADGSLNIEVNDLYRCLTDTPLEVLPHFQQAVLRTHDSMQGWAVSALRLPNWDRAAWLQPLAQVVEYASSPGARRMLQFHCEQLQKDIVDNG